MKIELTKEQLFSLAELAYLGNYVIAGVGEGDETKNTAKLPIRRIAASMPSEEATRAWRRIMELPTFATALPQLRRGTFAPLKRIF